MEAEIKKRSKMDRELVHAIGKDECSKQASKQAGNELFVRR